MATTQQPPWGKGLPRLSRKAKRVKGREAKKQLSDLFSTVSPTPSSSRSVTPSTFEPPSLTAVVGETD